MTKPTSKRAWGQAIQNRDEQFEMKRQVVLRTAARTYSDRGFHETTLADIAAAAGLTRGAIYWHFANKVELFNAMHERVALPFTEAMEKLLHAEDPLAALRERCVLDLQDIAACPQLQQVLAVLLHKCEYVDELAELCLRFDEQNKCFVEHSETVLARAHALGQLRDGVEPRRAAIALHNYMLGTISDWLFAPDLRYRLADEAGPLVDLFFAGLERPA